jgi:hypothetical protein
MFLYTCFELIPWSRALLQKLTVAQVVRKFLAMCGTQIFISYRAHKSAALVRVLSRTDGSLVNFTTHFFLSSLHFIVVLSFMPRSPKLYLPFRVSNSNVRSCHFSPRHSACLAHIKLIAWFCLILFGEKYKLWRIFLRSWLQPVVTLSLFGPNVLCNTPISNTLSQCETGL